MQSKTRKGKQNLCHIDEHDTWNNLLYQNFEWKASEIVSLVFCILILHMLAHANNEFILLKILSLVILLHFCQQFNRVFHKRRKCVTHQLSGHKVKYVLFQEKNNCLHCMLKWGLIWMHCILFQIIIYDIYGDKSKEVHSDVLDTTSWILPIGALLRIIRGW